MTAARINVAGAQHLQRLQGIVMQKWDYVFVLRNNLTGHLFRVFQSSLDKTAFDTNADAMRLFGKLTDPDGFANYKILEANVQHLYDQELRVDRDFYDELTESEKTEITRSVSHSSLISTLGVSGWQYVEFHKIGSKYRLYTFKKNRSDALTTIHANNSRTQRMDYLIFLRKKVAGQKDNVFPLLVPGSKSASVSNEQIERMILKAYQDKLEYSAFLKTRMPNKEYKNVEKQLMHVFWVSTFGKNGWEFIEHMKVGPSTRFHVFRREIREVLNP